MPAVELQVGDRTVRVTSPDKLYFPEVGITKLEMVEYVIAVGDGIFAALRDRPVTMERWPGGYRPDYFALETPALLVFPWDRQVIEGGELVTPSIYTGPVLHA